LLGVRWRSRVELERRLKQAGFPEDEISAALEDLERTGLIDDERFARELVRDQASRRMAGDRAIRSALRTKGVAPDVVERAVAADPSEEGDRALQLARRRAARMGNLPPEVAFRRLQGLLVRRGFGPGLSRDMARRALDGVDDDGMGIEPSDPD
jgi:regulatory protein